MQDKSSIVNYAMSSSVLNVNLCSPRLLVTSTFNLLKKADLRFGEAFVLYLTY